MGAMSTDPFRPLDVPCPIARPAAPISRVRRLVSMTVERPDLARVQRFFADFGLEPAAPAADGRLHLRGQGIDPVIYTAVAGRRAQLLGLAFEGTDDDLAALAAAEGAPIEETGEPGGGRRVRLCDPAGRWVDVIAGRTPRTPAPAEARPETPRINAAVRIPARPPRVRALGHVVLEAVAFDATVAWYGQRFGLIPSDVQVLADGTPGIVFLRCDRGEIPTDHHTLVLARSVEDRLNHAAFEVDDLDALAMGQQVLRTRGWRHAWGIGRHLLGSQLFDYWRDPWGDLVEHYCDGDRFDASHPPQVLPMTRDTQAQWGPPMPADFVDTRIGPRRLWRLLRRLRTEPELTVRRVLALKKALDG